MSWRTSDMTRLWLRRVERRVRDERPVRDERRVRGGRSLIAGTEALVAGTEALVAGTDAGDRRILALSALLSRPPLWNVVPRSSAPSAPPPPAARPSAG